MRALFTCVPQAGHLTPLLPLAEAFAAQGDDVVFASGADAEESVRRRGLGFRTAAPPFAEWFATLRARTRGTPGAGLPPDRVERYFVPRLFGEVGTALMVDDLLKACRELQPDLLVFDSVVFAAPLVSQITGVRGVQHTVGPVLEPTVLELVADAVSPIWEEFGRTVPSAAGVYSGTTLTIWPPSLDPAGARVPRAQPVRPTEAPRQPSPLPSSPLPLALPRPDDPVVYLTLGTFSNTNLALFRLVLDALAHDPVNVVVTVGADNDPADLAPWPANARVERFVRQADLLPHCHAVVHHAGAGTALGILAHGLPSVALPQSADNFTIARRLAAAGAARMLMPADVSEDAVRRAVREVLSEDGPRRAAQGLATEIAAMPPPQVVAERLRNDQGGSPGL